MTRYQTICITCNQYYETGGLGSRLDKYSAEVDEGECLKCVETFKRKMMIQMKKGAKVNFRSLKEEKNILIRLWKAKKDKFNSIQDFIHYCREEKALTLSVSTIRKTLNWHSCNLKEIADD